MDVKKALAAKEKDVENAALEFENAYLRHSSVFIEFQKEAQKYLNPQPAGEKSTNSPLNSTPHSASKSSKK